MSGDRRTALKYGAEPKSQQFMVNPVLKDLLFFGSIGKR
jgi:hypothetical protein